jgi:hypothetical protein
MIAMRRLRASERMKRLLACIIDCNQQMAGYSGLFAQDLRLEQNATKI